MADTPEPADDFDATFGGKVRKAVEDLAGAVEALADDVSAADPKAVFAELNAATRGVPLAAERPADGAVPLAAERAPEAGDRVPLAPGRAPAGSVPLAGTPTPYDLTAPGQAPEDRVPLAPETPAAPLHPHRAELPEGPLGLAAQSGPQWDFQRGAEHVPTAGLAPAARRENVPTAELAPKADALGNTLDALKGALDSLGPLTKGLASSLGNVLGSIKNAGAPLQALQEKHEAAGTTPGGLEVAGAALEGIAGPVTAVVGALQQAVGAVQQFVAALAPSSIMNFQKALDDLHATIGVAFQPIFDILANSFRQVAGVVAPVFEQLRPVVEQLTQVISGQMIDTVKTLAAVFEALMPLVKLVADLFDYLAALFKPLLAVVQYAATALGANLQILAALFQPVLEVLGVFRAVMDGVMEVVKVLQVVFKTLVESVVALVKSFLGALNLKDVFQAIADVTKKVVEGLLVAVATIAKFFGADDFLGRLIKGLGPKTGQVAAAQSPALKSFESVANDLALASAAAAGGGGAGAEHKFDLGDVVQQLKEIQSGESAGNTSLIVMLGKVKDVLNEILTALAKTKRVAKAGLGAVTAGVLGGAASAAFGLFGNEE